MTADQGRPGVDPLALSDLDLHVHEPARRGWSSVPDVPQGSQGR